MHWNYIFPALSHRYLEIRCDLSTLCDHGRINIWWSNSHHVPCECTFMAVNSLAPGKFEWTFRCVIFKRILVIDGWGISCEIALIWMSVDFIDDQLTLVQVMACCRQATSHYLNQCWPRSLSPYGVTRPEWVNCISCSSLIKIFSFLFQVSLKSTLAIFAYFSNNIREYYSLTFVYSSVTSLCIPAACICTMTTVASANIAAQDMQCFQMHIFSHVEKKIISFQITLCLRSN